MKNAFTMIELIFVIVIIGVLASVAIPKLAASRSDAEGAMIVNNLSTCINEAGNEYMVSASFQHITQSSDTNLTEACNSAIRCFSFVENDSNGTLQVSNVSSTEKKCIDAQRIATKNLLSTTHTISF